MKTREQVIERLRILEDNPWRQINGGQGAYAARHVQLAMEHEIDTLQWVLAGSERGAGEVAVFGRAMVHELNRPENAKKGGWSGCTADWLYMRAMEEMAEVKEALDLLHANNDNPQMRRMLLSELADVANFLMMIADVEKTLDK